MTNHEQPQRSPGDGRPRAFQGQASDVEAFVYIELPRAVDRDANVQAEISGPWCDHAHTLKASVPFGKTAPRIGSGCTDFAALVFKEATSCSTGGDG